MFDSLKRTFGMLRRMSENETKIRETHQLVSMLNTKIDELVLHNAGMHASLTNLMLKNEALLLKLDSNIVDKDCFINRNYANEGAYARNNQSKSDDQTLVMKPGPEN